MTTSTSIWIVRAEFMDRDDAVALMDLARELGITTVLSSRTVNERTSGGEQTPARTWRTGKVILAAMEPGRSYGMEHFMAAMEERGYKASSASPILSKLVEQGEVERLTTGVYRLRRDKQSEMETCESCKTPGLCRAATYCRQEPLRGT